MLEGSTYIRRKYWKCALQCVCVSQSGTAIENAIQMKPNEDDLIKIRRHSTQSRSAKTPPSIAYDLRDKTRLSAVGGLSFCPCSHAQYSHALVVLLQVPIPSKLIQASSFKPWHPVRVECGNLRGELMGGKSIDTDETCVLCSCRGCMDRWPDLNSPLVSHTTSTYYIPPVTRLNPGRFHSSTGPLAPGLTRNYTSLT